MRTMLISTAILNELTTQAKASPRLRMNLDLRNTPADQSQRMLNALEPGTVMPIHRHRHTSETVVVLRGKVMWLYYNDKGELTDTIGNNGQARAMRDFYATYLKRKDVTADGNSATSYISFRPEYYFIGLRQSAQQTNATLLQTVGWHDYSHGTEGTFDPLK